MKTDIPTLRGNFDTLPEASVSYVAPYGDHAEGLVRGRLTPLGGGQQAGNLHAINRYYYRTFGVPPSIAASPWLWQQARQDIRDNDVCEPWELL